MKRIILLLCSMVVPLVGFSQVSETEAETKVVFRFLPQNDIFFLSVYENEQELNSLEDFVGKYFDEIRSGEAPVYVTGYSNALPSDRENLATAKIRSNRVKSELITKKGLKEEDFRTINKVGRYDGQSSAVVVEITIPKKQAQPQPEPEPKPEPKPEAVKEVTQKTEPQPVVVEETIAEEIVYEKLPRYPYRFNIRTNLLYWVGLLPNIGIEWRVSPTVGIIVDGYYSNWKIGKETRHQINMVKPELRFYIAPAKRFYLGAMAHYGYVDMYLNFLNAAMSKGTGHEGNLIGGGLSVGYQAKLTKRLSMDFNVGLGYTQFLYYTYSYAEDPDGNQIIIRDQPAGASKIKKDYWGPIQAGVSLVWGFGKGF